MIITRVITSHDGFLGQTHAAIFEDSVKEYAPGATLALPSDAQEMPVTVVDLNVGDDLLPVNVQDQSAMTFSSEEFARGRTPAGIPFSHAMELPANFLLRIIKFPQVITHCNPSA